MTRRFMPSILALVSVVFVVGGCELLQAAAGAPVGGAWSGSVSGTDMPFPSEGLPNELRKGSATIRITSGEPKTVALDRVQGATVMDVPGSGQAGFGSWTNASSEWQLRIEMPPAGAEPTIVSIVYNSGDVAIIAEGRDCQVHMTQSSSSNLAGTAECHSLRWLNAGRYMIDGNAGDPLPNHPPFDMTVEFEAH